jgi:hypothetical protein
MATYGDERGAAERSAAQTKDSLGTIIIVIAVVAVAVGGWWYYSHRDLGSPNPSTSTISEKGPVVTPSTTPAPGNTVKQP